jgi:phospholipid/cholesterol/gamma-HCH transport system ATP-binding protein
LYLHSRLKLTVVMVTHDLDTLFRTCTRVGVIVDRRMITDTLDGMLANPHPWIQEYFHGPRARGAEMTERPGEPRRGAREDHG